MPLRQRILSAFFVAFIALKVAEGFLRWESWPLTHTPMFSGYIPRNVVPHRVRLEGSRGGPWFELEPSYFDLTRDELVRRLYFDLKNLGANCGELGRLSNARRRLPIQRLRALRAHVEPIARPGVIAAPPPEIVPCPLGPAGRATP
jgi:hypothetical protein